MIEVQRREQFTKAAERLRQEPQSIRRHEPGLWIVTNKVKNHAYAVRLIQQDGKTFMRCGCEAGTPTKGRRVPMVCKHMCALVIFLRAVREMRRAASH
jgi:hypothetical protein